MSVASSLRKILQGIDEDIFNYITGMIEENPNQSVQELIDTIGPFFVSTGFVEGGDEDAEVRKICERISKELNKGKNQTTLEKADKEKNETKRNRSDVPTLLNRPMCINDFVKESQTKQELDMVDSLWGVDKVRKLYNDVMDGAELGSKKDKRITERLIQKELAKFNADDEDEDNQITRMMIPEYSYGVNQKDIHVREVTLNFKGLLLLDSAELRLVYGRRYGLIGKNGIGKTTLLKQMASFEIDGFPRSHRVLHVQQEVRSSPKRVIDVVLEADIERTTLLEEEKALLQKIGMSINFNQESETKEKELMEKIQQMKNSVTTTEGGENVDESRTLDRLKEVHERLQLIKAYTAESRAAKILSGLQFSVEMQENSVNSLSGGWRHRAAIAAALFIEPDLLLLDEPTNHLDLEAVLWLQNYLQEYPHTILIVSHDRSFLNGVATDIINFHNLKLEYFRGDYDTFEKRREELIKNQKRAFESQQFKRQHMQEFIDKFRYNAKRASLVQSRIKALEKIENVEEVEEESPFRFNFINIEALNPPIISIDDISFGYDQTHPPLFTNVNLNINLSTRMGILGPNGSGKSTFLKIILNELEPWSGAVHRNANIRVATFTQHHADSLDFTQSALDNMLEIFPGSLEHDMRAFLGRFGLNGNIALRPIKFLSGGQKSRVAFAKLVYTRPHVVIMDEPTNHLDLDTIDALIIAVKEYNGGVVVVSHDQHFISQVCDELYIVERHAIKKFTDDFFEYKNIICQRAEAVANEAIQRNTKK